MDDRTRYRILGPLAVAGTAPVTAGRDRAVLALLLLHHARVVGVGELVDAVWGEDPPTTARNQLQTCVSRLRRLLPAGAIRTEPAGYRIHLEQGDLDAAEFDRLVAAAREQRDAGLYRQALSLWRGPALAEIESHAVRQAAVTLDERRAIAVEDWADLEIATGHGRELIAELSALVEEFPLRERLRGQLMVALYRAGRQADALAEFRRAARVLRDDLGIEPGPALRDLHGQILAGGPPEPDRPAPGQQVRSLPRTVGDFTGRAEVVERLVRSIVTADPFGPAIAVIDGMAGSGKTTLALHVAALVGDRFPDAHLFVDLHGHSEQAPVEPSAALFVLLRQLGVSADLVPADLVERVALWRNELARRRVLLILDNASSSAQLIDLLPTVPGSLAVVTSRRRLAGLDGVHPESLAVLPTAEATTLLARIVGDRVAAEPDAAAEVVRRCGGLPLAIRLAGARLAHRPRWRVSDLVRRLGESALEELAAEDRSVASAFAVSYGHLSAPVQRVFRMVALSPGARFDGPAAAALTGLPLDEVMDALDDLVDVHLIEEPEPEIFRLHDLIQEFAVALAAELPAEERRTAMVALLDFQLHMAIAATGSQAALEIVIDDIGPLRPQRPDLLAAVTDPYVRLEWERSQLVVLVDAAVAYGVPEYGWWIPRGAWRFLYTRSYDDDLRVLLTRALTIVEGLGDRTAIATISNYLAATMVRAADYPRGLELLQTTLRVRTELGMWGAVSSALGNLASLYETMGRFTESLETALKARRLALRVGDPRRSRIQLVYLATAYERLGRLQESLYFRRLSLFLAIEQDDRPGIALTLAYIQSTRRALGEISAATAHRYLSAALWRIGEQAHMYWWLADIRDALGNLLRDEGRFAEALVEHEFAVDRVRRSRDRRHEALFLRNLATTRLAAGDSDGALETFEAGLRLAERVNLPYERAGAQAGIAACVADKDPERARRLYAEALALYRGLRVPEQFVIEQRLAALGGTDHPR